MKFVVNEGLYHEGELIAEFDPRVVKKILFVNDTEEERQYEVEITMWDGRKLPSRRLKKLTDMKYFELWPEITDAVLSKKTRELLLLRLQQTAQTAPEQVVYLFHKNGIYKTTEKNALLVLGDHWFCQNNSAKIKVELSKELKNIRWNVVDLPNADQVYNCLQDFMEAAPGASEIVTCSVMLSVAKPFFIEAGYNPDFCLNLYGKSGSYKTSLIKAVTPLVRGNPGTSGSFINDSKKLILEKMERMYGFPILLDDYHPGAKQYDRDRQRSIMDAVVRKTESDPCTGFVFMTAEFLDGCYSLQDRLLQIQMQSMDSAALGKIQRADKKIAAAALRFVIALMENFPKVISDIKDFQEKINSSHEKAKCRAERHGEALLMTADLLENYLRLNGRFKETLTDALKKQANIQEKHMKLLRRLESQDSVELVHELLQSGVYEIFSEYDKSYAMEPNQFFLREREFIYITKTALLYGLKNLYGMQSINLKKIVDELHDRDVLVEDNDALTKKFYGVRHLCISRSALENYVKWVRK